MHTLKDLLDLMEYEWKLTDGDLFETVNARRLIWAKQGLNNLQLDCNKDRRMRQKFLKKGRLLVKAEVTTGTVSVENDLKTVTFSSAILTADFKGRVFVCDDDSDVEHRFASITSSTVGKLDVEYAGTTNATATFKILKDRYYLGRDILGIWNMIDRTNESIIRLENRTGLSDPNIFDVDTDDDPSDGAIILSDETLYDTGTVGVDSSNNNITHSATGFIAAFDGLPIRIDGDTADYIFTYVDASNGTLDRTYEGTTAATAAFKIAPPGQWQVELYEKPTSQILVDYDYLYRLPKLVGDNDISVISVLHELTLWEGAIYLTAKFNNTNPQAVSSAEMKYEREKDKMADAIGELIEEIGVMDYHDI